MLGDTLHKQIRPRMDLKHAVYVRSATSFQATVHTRVTEMPGIHGEIKRSLTEISIFIHLYIYTFILHTLTVKTY